MLSDLIEFIGSDNIAEELDKDQLTGIGSRVAEGYRTDRQDRAPWEDKMKDAMDLALQNAKQKSFPWLNASNVMMPVISEAIIQYNSRMYPALIPPTGIVKSRVVGSDPTGEKQNSAIRVSKYMSWQILDESEEWEEEMDWGMIVQPLLGQMYKKTYFEETLGKNISTTLSPNEFVMCNNAKSVEKSFRKTHFFDMTANELKSLQLQGFYLDVEIGKPQKDDSDKPESQQTSETDDSTPYRILEQHTWEDLDNDGLMEPYIVTVEEKSQNVLKIVAGYSEEDILADEETVLNVAQEQYFTKYGFIPNPDGSIMDLGFGQLLGPLNKSINTNINQLNDAGTLNNTGGGLLGRGVKIKGGVIKRRMGEYLSVPTSGQDLARNVVHFPQMAPSSVLFNLLGMMMTAAQRISSTLDSQVGENPGQNQKATTTIAVQQEGKRVFSGIYKRTRRSLGKEMRRWYYLNSINLLPEQYLEVLDGLTEQEKEKVGETLFKADFDLQSTNIIPAADSVYTSEEQKMAKANALLQKIPTGLVNPKVAMQRALEAEEQPGIEQIMTMPEPQPPLEVIKHQDEMQMRRAELLLETLSRESDWINSEIKTTSEAMLNLAKAESEEAGIQYEEYAQQLEILREMAQQNVMRMKGSQGQGQPQGQQQDYSSMWR